MIDREKMLEYWKLIIIAGIFIILGAIIGLIGCTPRVEYVDRVEYMDRVEYIDRPEYRVIEKITYRNIYRNIYSRQWESIEQFTDWYYAQNFTALFPSGAYIADCDDYAEWVQTKALEQGYSISIALTWHGKLYNNKKVTNEYKPGQPGHVGNMVEIQGVYYYFEPAIDRFNGLIKIIRRD